MTDTETADERVLHAVLTALAAVEDVDPGELEFALYDWIDPDALAALCEDSRGFMSVTFDVDTHEVTIQKDGWIIVDGDAFAIDDLLDT